MLLTHHEQLLGGSAIDPEVAAERGYFSARTKAELRELGFPPSQCIVPTMVVPIYNVLGEVATYQHRPDRPRMNREGKPIKYETRAGSKVVIDVPRRAKAWLPDRNRPLFITEGSRKADAAVSLMLCCIALLGVWNWRDADGMLPDWENIGLKGRKVYIVFDSDVMEKVSVHMALVRVKAALEHRGAQVMLIYLPHGEGGAKLGLDDYLALPHTVEELLALAIPDLQRPEAAAIAAPEIPPARPPRRSLDEVVATFQSWIYLPDPAPLYAVLGAYVANRFSGPPVWLMLVGPPSSGKTEILMPLTPMRDVRLASTLTEPSLLSGTANRERAADAKGGLLREIGDQGMILMKDFTSLISQNRDTRAAVLGALREIYDGSWTRHVGVDGGKELHWSGKVGIIVGVTPAIDSHHSVMASLGERFLMLRLEDIAEDIVTRVALNQSDENAARKAALGEAVAGLLSDIEPNPLLPELSAEETDYLVLISRLAVRGRSAVERDSGGSKEILLVPQPEVPARFAQALQRLIGGMLAIGVERAEAWRIVRRVALSSMPALRHSALEVLLEREGWTRTAPIGVALRHPTNTTLRTLEDLQAHGLIERRAERDKEPGAGVAYEWRIADWCRQSLDAPLPTTFPQSQSYAGTEYLYSGSVPTGDAHLPTPPVPDSGERCGSKLDNSPEHLTMPGLQLALEDLQTPMQPSNSLMSGGVYRRCPRCGERPAPPDRLCFRCDPEPAP